VNISAVLANGLALGGGYALLAIGWTVLLGAARLVNFAHGQFFMLGAFLAWYVVSGLGLSYLAAIPAVLIAGALLGVVLQLALSRLVLEQNLVSIMLVTLAVGYMLEGSAGLFIGGDPRVIDSPFNDTRVAVGSSGMPLQDLLIVVLAVLLYLSVWFVLRRTRAGAVVRGVAEDPALAPLYGISPAAVYVGVFAFAGASAMLAGFALGPRSPILISMGFHEVIITFAVVVIGGVGRIWGNLAAAFGFGIFTAFIGQVYSQAFSLAAAFAVVIIYLVARPKAVTA
jgi:branched-chain amino acid transport system permease protein